MVSHPQPNPQTFCLEMAGADFLLERGYARKTAPAYVQACCVLRGVTATNVGIGLYLDNFHGTDEEKVPTPSCKKWKLTRRIRRERRFTQK
jgi:hypothetical protein